MFRTVHRLDLAGQQFGRLTVVEKCKRKGAGGEIYWLCKCECGAMMETLAYPLRCGRTKSCGCYSRERTRKHGMEGTRIYDCWAHMLDRCRNPKNRGWKHYGGRGITVCERWLDFRNFYADMGDMPPGRSIDRINNDGNYTPENCRWATASEQIKNQRPRLRNKAGQFT